MSKYPTIEVQDNTRVAKQQKEEAIPIPIVSKQSYVSSDNRTDWQREQSQKQAERDYNQLMKDKTTQQGLQNIIGFTNFADAVGLASGGLNLLGKGAKWALKKGAKQFAEYAAESRKLGIVPFQQRTSKFKSELDWSPKSWFEDAGKWEDYTQADIDALNSHLPEYLEIERLSKQNGTWLKLPNGKIWEGDPRSWVQLMSKDGQKMAMPSRTWKGGMPGDEYYSPYYDGRVWMSDNADVWNSFAYKQEGFYHERPSGINYSLTVPKNTKMTAKDAKGKDFISIDHMGREISTDEIVDEAQKHGFGTTTIFNVVEGPHYAKGLNVPTNDFVIHKGTPRKSILGNNGNFNLNNKNIYRGFIPLGIAEGIEYGNQQRIENIKSSR